MEFFLEFKFVNFVVRVCCGENVVYIVDVYLKFSYYCFEHFFNVGHIEFGYGRTKGQHHRNTVNLYKFVTWGVIEWDFFCTLVGVFRGKRLEKKLDGNYTRMLRAILNKSWQQHPTRHQLYGHLPPITKSIQVRRTWHAGHCWRSRDELIRDVLLWIPTHGRAKAGRPSTNVHSAAMWGYRLLSWRPT